MNKKNEHQNRNNYTVTTGITIVPDGTIQFSSLFKIHFPLTPNNNYITKTKQNITSSCLCSYLYIKPGVPDNENQ